MKILLIEDDEHKRERVARFLAAFGSGVEVRTARSVQSGIKALRTDIPDCVLLDMSLPVFDYSRGESGFHHLAYGGKDILDYIEQAAPTLPVIVITAFDRFGGDSDAMTLDELSSELSHEYPNNYRGSVWYSALQHDWQDHLSVLIKDTARREPEL